MRYVSATPAPAAHAGVLCRLVVVLDDNENVMTPIGRASERERRGSYKNRFQVRANHD